MRSDSGEFSHEKLEPACERAQVLITRHIDGEGSAGDTQDLRAHLGACPRCRRALEIQTAQSHKLAEAFRTLWPGDNGLPKKRLSDPLELWKKHRPKVLRAASLLIVVLAILAYAVRAQAPSEMKNSLAPAPAHGTPDPEKPNLARAE